VNSYDEIFVVEQNRDGQLHQILSMDYPERAPYFKSVAHGDGLPAAANWVRKGILARHAVAEKV
jgi:2-oxoglutarate ferredoxin oxidoreductase subunit alpha